jgi:uncharacterized protein YraI
MGTSTTTPTSAPALTSTPIEVRSPVAFVISPNGLNLRAGPGTNYEIIGFLDAGEMLDIQGRNSSYDWIQVVNDASNILGWVSAAPNLVQIRGAEEDIPVISLPASPTPSPIPSVSPTASATKVRVKTAPTLIDPQPYASHYRNRMDLEWEWAGTLGANEYFQVEIRNRYNAFEPRIDEAVSPIDVAWVKTTSYRYDVIDEAYDREYTWRVGVVKGIPPREKDWSTPDNRVWEPPPKNEVEKITAFSQMRVLFVEPGDRPPSDPGPEPTRKRERN